MSMLLTADWVLPVSRPPIRHGAVLAEDGVVLEVVTTETLSSAARDADEVRNFPGCVLMPGLVNAHTHLSLSALGGLIGPAPFEEWLPRLVATMRSWDADDHRASATLGALRCLEAGVTVVGDIVYGPESVEAATGVGLGGIFYWEVLGITPPSLFATLEQMAFPGPEAETARIRRGISPHAPYSSGPELLKAVHRTAGELAVPMSIHVAESDAETELMLHGTGSLAATAERLAHGFQTPGVSPVSYLDQLGVLDGTTAIHLCTTDTADISRLVAAARGAVTCPRSNAYLSNHPAQVHRLLQLGLPVGLGTDSAASNHDLDLLAEARALHAAEPDLEPRTLIAMATAMGAVALGLEDRFGVLEPGMQSDVTVFRTGETDDPEHDVVRCGGCDTIEAVFAGGEWRVLDGRLIAYAPEEGVARAVSRAQAALAAQ